MLHVNIFHYLKRSGTKEQLATDSAFRDAIQEDKTQESKITTRRVPIGDEAGKIQNERSLSLEQIA